MNKIILIDNGHGVGTAGKRSPDGRIHEWEYTRRLARALCQELRQAGRDARLVVEEDDDVPLRQRVARVNAVPGDKLLVSLHLNACGMGDRWCQARGWGVFVAPNASRQSIDLAIRLSQQARMQGLTVRQPSPTQPYWVQSLAMCRDTRCPAVLTENLFMDNLDDAQLLQDPQVFRKLVALHAQALAQ